MANGKRKCEICGKEYPYCTAWFTESYRFRWQDVACCPEHGKQYFVKVLTAAGEDIPDFLLPAADGGGPVPTDTAEEAGQDYFEEDEDSDEEDFEEDEDPDEEEF